VSRNPARLEDLLEWLHRVIPLASRAQPRRASMHLLVPLSPPSGGGCMPMLAGGLRS
jgi:hypothetical protein